MTTFTEFDPSKYLDNEEAIALYLAEASDDANPDVFIAARGDIAKARGMTQIGGIGRWPRKSLQGTPARREATIPCGKSCEALVLG